ncbi:MAG: diversity-generating retroelement protein Avd [Saprospiraceae bacterium]
MQIKAEPITLKAYELLKYAVPVFNRMPKNQKFVLADRLQNHLTDLLESLLEATYLPADAKRPVLTAVNLRLEKLRFLYRLGFDLGYFSAAQYREFAARTDEIGRMTGGWLRSLK